MEIAETHQNRASRYRHTAARLRQQADALDGTRERRELLEIADQYDRLANRLTRARAEAERARAEAEEVGAVEGPRPNFTDRAASR
jgi:hypothetical protein